MPPTRPSISDFGFRISDFPPNPPPYRYALAFIQGGWGRVRRRCLANRRRQQLVAEAGDRLPSATCWRRCFTAAAGRE